MARVLVTGGAGFIGSHLCEACLRVGEEVTAVDNLATGSAKNLPAGVRFIQGDLRDPSLSKTLLDEFRPDVVYHLAAQSSVIRSIGDPIHDLEVNVRSTLHLLEACRAARRPPAFAYASTGGASLPESRAWPSSITSTASEHLENPDAPVSDFIDDSPGSDTEAVSPTRAAKDHDVRAASRMEGILLQGTERFSKPFSFLRGHVPEVSSRRRGDGDPVHHMSSRGMNSPFLEMCSQILSCSLIGAYRMRRRMTSSYVSPICPRARRNSFVSRLREMVVICFRTEACRGDCGLDSERGRRSFRLSEARDCMVLMDVMESMVFMDCCRRRAPSENLTVPDCRTVPRRAS